MEDEDRLNDDVQDGDQLAETVSQLDVDCDPTATPAGVGDDVEETFDERSPAGEQDKVLDTGLLRLNMVSLQFTVIN